MSILIKDQITAIFDIGHGSLRLITIDESLEKMAAFSVPIRGFTKGKVRNLQDFTACISEVVKTAGIGDIDLRAIVIIPSVHTRYKIQTLSHRTSGIYRSSDYAALVEASADSGSGELDEVIDTRFLSFKLDNTPIDPLSFAAGGREISAQIKLATHPKLILADIVTAMNGAGIEVSEFRSTGFGLATAVSILKPNASNCVLVDIGHSGTTGVLTVGGTLHSIFSVSAGSDHITRDLVAGLSCEYSVAESIKLDSGIKMEGTSDSPTEANIQRIMKPRISEILQLAFKNFALYARSLDGGFLLVGAGSQLTGLSHFISKQLGVATPFVCSLTPSTAESLSKLRFEGEVPHLNSGWLALLSHVRLVVNETTAIRFERKSRPMSKLRPLWTWLSELSR